MGAVPMSGNRVLNIVSKLLTFFIFILFFGSVLFYIKSAPKSLPESDNSPVIVKKEASITHGKMTPAEVHNEFQFFNLPADLHSAQIHDILFYSNAMWLGTDKGLVKINGNDVTVYKQFSEWPFEWVSNLVATPHGMVVQTYVAMGNTNGKRAGSHVFDIENEIWTKIGANVKAQTWFDGHLYQVGSTLFRRDPSELWAKQVLLDSVCKPGASKLRMKAINNEIWITGQGTAGDYRHHYSFGCGVIRYNPNSEHSISYKKDDGLNHNKGWDLDGDSGGVYVTHSGEHNRLSYFDFKKQKWTTMRASGYGNRMTVSPEAIWLAVGNPRRPIRHIERESQTTQSFSQISEKEFVSTFGVNAHEVWFGTYEKHWKDQKYSISSRLGLYIDKSE